MKRVILVAAVLLAVSVACRKGEQAQSAVDSAAVQQPAPELRLTQADGQVFDLAQQRGRIVLVFFGYTQCPDYCPTTLADFASVKRRLGIRADSVRFVFVTVDPARDTPDVAARYARQFDRTFIGLSGDSVTLAQVQRSFHVASIVEKDSTGAIQVGHSALVFIVGKDGKVGNTVLPGDGRAEWLLNAVNEELARS